MHEYVQKSTSTTFPRRAASVSGLPFGVLIHVSMPRELGCARVAGVRPVACTAAPRPCEPRSSRRAADFARFAPGSACV